MRTAIRYRALRAFATSLASIALVGCALSGRHETPVATFVLEGAPAPAALETASAGLVLKISMPDAAPAYASSQMAYIEQPYRIDYFARNEWADPPSRMLKTLLTQQLSNCGLFRFVFSDSAGVDETLRLDSELVELVQAFDASSSQLRVTIRFDLIDVAQRAILLSETISASEPAARDPYSGVVAANAAVQRVLDQLVARLHQPVASLRSAP